jgi:hypothetical protein
LSKILEFKFSKLFKGGIWKLVADESAGALIFEIRYEQEKRVVFSALDIDNYKFLWEEQALEEAWWVQLLGSSEGVILYTLYVETDNPDHKALLAFDLKDHTMLWFKPNLSMNFYSDKLVWGVSSKPEKRVVLDLLTGREMVNFADEKDTVAKDTVIRPVQYADGTDHFSTIKRFLSGKLNLLPVIALEYVEYQNLIFISFNVMEEGLVNYLLVLQADGEILLHETLDSPQKGIGVDTFFIWKGCLFFVKNRKELVSYNIV